MRPFDGLSRRNQAVSVQSKDPVDQWIELKASFAELRGWDEGRNRRVIPRTTVADVQQLAAHWAQAARKGKLHDSERRKWLAALDRVAELAGGKRPEDRFPDNEWFWQAASRRLAIDLASKKVIPSRFELAVESLGEAVGEMPATLGKAGDALAGAGNKAGNVLVAPIAGAAQALGIDTKTLLIGAGALVGGAVLVSKLLND